MGALYPTLTAGLAVDPVAPDQIEDKSRGIARETNKLFASIPSETLQHAFGVDLQAGDDLATISPGSTEARLDRFEKPNIGPCLGKV